MKSVRTKTNKNSGADSPYLPVKAIIKDAEALTARDTLLTIAVGEGINYQPGQFLMAGLPGHGEAAISIASPPAPAAKTRTIDLCIRNAGSLTAKLCGLRKKDTIWLRGPMGRGFDMPPRGEDILFVIGGMGLVPARSLIKAVIKKRKSYGKITILYGIKTSHDLLFGEEIKEWQDSGAVVEITTETPEAEWQGKQGVVTTLIPALYLDHSKTTAYLLGPPAMYRYVVVPLSKKGIAQDKTFLSLERRMRCALGKCGHCLIGGVYICRCGPVFRLTELADMPGAI